MEGFDKKLSRMNLTFKDDLIDFNKHDIQKGKGITVNSSEGCTFFDLNPPAIFKLKNREIVKRLAISYDDFMKMTDRDFEVLAEKMEDELESLGCSNYIFTPADGGSAFKYIESMPRYLELRLFGIY